MTGDDGAPAREHHRGAKAEPPPSRFDASRVALPGQLELFNPPPAAPKPRTVAVTSTKPRWTRYKAVRPHRCDFCVLNQVEDPDAPVALKARWRRRVAGEEDRFLCARHASDQRVLDGMKPLRGAQ